MGSVPQLSSYRVDAKSLISVYATKNTLLHKKMIIENQTRNTVLADQGRVADNFFSRLKGLMGVPVLKQGEGLLLKKEKSIHTFFMRFPIDVIYINSRGKVIKIDQNMVPNRIGRYVSQSDSILELPAGTIEETETAVGDQLKFLMHSGK